MHFLVCYDTADASFYIDDDMTKAEFEGCRTYRVLSGEYESDELNADLVEDIGNELARLIGQNPPLEVPRFTRGGGAREPHEQ